MACMSWKEIARFTLLKNYSGSMIEDAVEGSKAKLGRIINKLLLWPWMKMLRTWNKKREKACPIFMR